MAHLETIGVLTAKPGSEDEVLAAMRAVLEPSRDEPGCLQYLLYASPSDPAVLITVEKWRDQAALDTHMRSDHVKQCIRAAGRHLAVAPSVYTVVAVDPPVGSSDGTAAGSTPSAS